MPRKIINTVLNLSVLAPKNSCTTAIMETEVIILHVITPMHDIVQHGYALLIVLLIIAHRRFSILNYSAR